MRTKIKKQLALHNKYFNLIPWVIFSIITYYVGIFLFNAPALDFNFSRGTITDVLSSEPNLAVGDKIIQVGKKDWDSLEKDLANPIFGDFEAGDQIPLLILTEGGEEKLVSVTWRILTSKEFFARGSYQWVFGYFFWFSGTLVFLSVRPRDTRWRLMVTYLFLFGIWLATGSGASLYHLGGGAIVMRIISWLLLPVMLHLHWDFPHPFDNPPISLRKGALYLAYPIAVFMSLFQFSSYKFYNTFSIGMSVGLLGSILLLFAHYFIQKEYRRDTNILFIFTITAFLPLVLVGYIYSQGIQSSNFPLGISILGLPLIPFAYFYTIARKQLGKYELRANRIIGIYLYVIFLFILTVSLTLVFSSPEENQSANFTDILLGGMFTAAITILIYQPFLKFVDKHILGIPTPPEEILHLYTETIIASTEPKELADILQRQILGSMQIQESALLDNTISDQENSSWLYLDHVSPPSLSTYDYGAIQSLSGKYLIESEQNQLPKGYQWIRLILPLTFNDQAMGLWFFGRKAPDDYYSQAEIEILQTLANQTAIALMHYQQANSLRALYQVNIYRHEMERASLGRDLHDETLNRLANLKRQTNEPDLKAEIDNTIDNLREIIYGLRPDMLNFGLMTAVEDLANNLNLRREDVIIDLDIEGEISPLEDPFIELQIFRIVQQACDNALAQESTTLIQISGQISTTKVELSVKDDGPGFELDTKLTLTNLLEQKHFGLAGMHERAELIQASLDIQSKPGDGASIIIKWPIIK